MTNWTILYTREEVLHKIRKHKQIYIWGAGKIASILIADLSMLGVSISGLIVSDKEKNPNVKDEVEVYSLEEVEITSECLIILGISDLYISEVYEILKDKDLNVLQLDNTYVLRDQISFEKKSRLPKIEITGVLGCAINCKFCPQKALVSKYYEKDKNRRKVMLYDDFAKMLDKIPKDTIISFSGFVEPFHHPESVKMMQYAHEKGFKLELFTTFDGVKWEQYEQIKNIPFDAVVLHTPDIKGYAHIHTEGDYWRIIDDVLNLKKENGYPFVDEANCQSEPTEEFLSKARNRIQVISELNDRAGSLDSTGLKNKESFKDSIKCIRSEKQRHWVVLPDGTVQLCCMDFGLNHTLGNIFTGNYADILKSNEYDDIRKGMEQIEEKTVICRKCVYSRYI